MPTLAGTGNRANSDPSSRISARLALVPRAMPAKKDSKAAGWIEPSVTPLNLPVPSMRRLLPEKILRVDVALRNEEVAGRGVEIRRHRDQQRRCDRVAGGVEQPDRFDVRDGGAHFLEPRVKLGFFRPQAFR